MERSGLQALEFGIRSAVALRAKGDLLGEGEDRSRGNALVQLDPMARLGMSLSLRSARFSILWGDSVGRSGDDGMGRIRSWEQGTDLGAC